MLKMIVERNGLGELTHIRTPTTPERQTVIRMNRDTLYTSAVVDLSTDVIATLPAAEGRYTSMHVVNQDHFSIVYSKPGTYTLTKKTIGTRYAFVIFRVFVDGITKEDTKKANQIQDRIKLTGGGTVFAIPNWNRSEVEKMTASLNALAASLPSSIRNRFGQAEEVDPIYHLVGTASGWGGLPNANAVYLDKTPEFNDGIMEYELIVRDVPVDAFWSITVYNSKGFLEPNARGMYSLNNYSAKKRADGSYLIHFVRLPKPGANALPIMPGWNYTVRLFQPRDAILNGDWTFPNATPVSDPASEPSDAPKSRSRGF